MDPRTRNYSSDYGKRRASRSPDNRLPPKVPKSIGHEEASAPTTSYPSRCLSLSTGPPSRASRPGDPRVPDSRRPSYQNPSEFRTEFSVNSPDSFSSRRIQHEEATSGRSTPLSNYGAIGRPIPAATTATATTNGTSIEDVLMRFSEQIVQLARLEIHHEQGLSSVKQATQEYNEMKKFFPDFPVIKEQKTTARAAAEKRLKAIEADIIQGKAKQKNIAENIAAIVKISAEVKPNESRDKFCKDPPSRADHDQPIQKCGELQNEIRDVKLGISGNNVSCSERELEGIGAKVIALDARVAEVDRTITSLNLCTTQINSRISNIEKKMSEILGLQIKSILDQVSTFQAKLTQFENNFSPGRRSVHLSSETLNHADDVTDELVEVKQTIDGLQGQLAQLSRIVIGDNNTGFKELPSEDDCVLKQIHHLKQYLELKHKLETGISTDHVEGVEDKVQECGDDFVEREADIDQVKSDNKPLKESLSDEVDGRLKKVEQAMRLLEGSIPMAINSRLQKLEKDVEAIDTSDGPLGKIEEVISKHIDEEVKDIRGHLTAVSQRHIEDLHAIRAAQGEVEIKMVDLSTKVNAIERSVAESVQLKEDLAKHTTAIKELWDDVSKKIDTEYITGVLEEMKKSFQPVAPLSVQAPSRLPTQNFPTQAMQTPHQPSHSHFHSPFPSINGPKPPTSVFPLPSNYPATSTLVPNLQFAQEIKHLNDRCDALQIVTSTLQTRYNNLTTGDVCKAMLDQAADVWPHAKNFELAVGEIKAACTRQDREMQMLKTKIAQLGENLRNMETDAAVATTHQGRDTATTNLSDVRVLADQAKNAAEAMEKSLVELDRRVGHTLATAVEARNAAESARGSSVSAKQEAEMANSHAQGAERRARKTAEEVVGVQGEINKLREELTEVQKTLKAVPGGSPVVDGCTTADHLKALQLRLEGWEDAIKQVEAKVKEAGTLNKVQSSRFSKFNIEGMKKDLEDVVEKVRVLTETEGDLVETVSALGKSTSEQGRTLAAGREELDIVKGQIEQIKLLYAGLEHQFEKVSKDFDWTE